jgi:hypothetical protein
MQKQDGSRQAGATKSGTRRASYMAAAHTGHAQTRHMIIAQCSGHQTLDDVLRPPHHGSLIIPRFSNPAGPYQLTPAAAAAAAAAAAWLPTS